MAAQQVQPPTCSFPFHMRLPTPNPRGLGASIPIELEQPSACNRLLQLIVTHSHPQPETLAAALAAVAVGAPGTFKSLGPRVAAPFVVVPFGSPAAQ